MITTTTTIQWIFCYTSCLGMTFNILLLCLIRKNSDSQWANYRLFLTVNCVHSAIFAFMNGISQSAYIIDHQIIMVIATGPITSFGHGMTEKFLCVWIVVTVLSWLLLPSTYIYQYFVLCRNHITRKTIMWIYLSVLLIGTPLMFTVHLLIPTKEFHRRYRHVAAEMLGMPPNEPVQMLAGSIVIQDENRDRGLLPFMLFALVIPFMVDYLVMGFCAAKIFIFLKKNTSLHPKTRRMQINIMKMLVVQALVPFLLLGGPVWMFISSAAFGFNLGKYCVLIGILFSCMPIAESFILAYFIKPFSMMKGHHVHNHETTNAISRFTSHRQQLGAALFLTREAASSLKGSKGSLQVVKE